MPHVYPYTDAPRLPEAGELDLSALVPGAGTPVEIEIGPGRGWFLVERLEAVPDARLVGLEIRRKWATIVDRRLASRGLGTRGRVFAEDARLVLPRVPSGSVRAVFIHFPDPWWKKRHQKRRVATGGLLEEVVRVLVPGGELFLQTDVEERASEFETLVESAPLLAPAGDGSAGPGARLSENPYLARSPRERRAMKDGLPVVRLRYRRLPASP
ncbi:MAG TPA: tRNA (guanine-N7)-methyltransferase [Polyangiaceae bacterium]|nr:tRNA (guanine-N7)-methyltransferase [Polyangiaceae bacterium]